MKYRSIAGNGSGVFAEARVWARVCVRTAHSQTQRQSADAAVARPLNRYSRNFSNAAASFADEEENYCR